MKPRVASSYIDIYAADNSNEWDKYFTLFLHVNPHARLDLVDAITVDCARAELGTWYNTAALYYWTWLKEQFLVTSLWLEHLTHEWKMIQKKVMNVDFLVSKVEPSNLLAVAWWPSTSNKIRKSYFIFHKISCRSPVEQILSTRSSDNDEHYSCAYFLSLVYSRNFPASVNCFLHHKPKVATYF